MRRTFLLTFLLAAVAVSAPACGRPADSGTAATPAAAPGDTLPQIFARKLVGTAGGERVELWVRREGELVSGAWVGEEGELWISGTLGPGDSLSSPVYGSDGDPVAALEARLTNGADGISLFGTLLHPGNEPRSVQLVEERVSLSPTVRIVPRSWLEEDAEMGWSLHSEIPAAESVKGGGLAPEFAAFNAAVDSLVREDAGPYLEEVEGGEPPDPESTPSIFESGYEVTAAGGRIVSIAFDASVYFSGAAHPTSHSWTLTWDFDAGRPVTLDALFASGAPYLDTLSAYVIPELQRKLGEDADVAWVEEGAAPTPENYEAWAITPEGLRVLFGSYQVAPYVMGPQEVVVRWSALEPILDPAGPVARIRR